MTASVSSIARPQLSIGVYLQSSDLTRSIEEILAQDDRYTVSIASSEADFFQLAEHQKQQLDCLILQDGKDLETVLNQLRTEAVLLPIVILHSEQRQLDLRFFYHTAEMWVSFNELHHIGIWIDRAIEEFLELSPVCQLPDTITPPDFTQDLIAQNFLMLQQRRLTDKLKERLGYLGIYYKRSPKAFLKNLPPQEQQEFLEELRLEYRAIVLSYFQDDQDLNQRIDNFVNAAFFCRRACFTNC